MLRTFVVVAIASLAVACGSPSKTEKLLAKMKELSAKVCACKDADCSQRAQDAIREWSKKEGFGLSEIAELKFTPAQEKTVIELKEAMTACEKRILETGPFSATAAAHKLTAFRTELCDCEDLPCVEKVEAAVAAWDVETATALKNLAPTEDQQYAMDTQRLRMKSCKDNVLELAAEAAEAAADAGQPPSP